jgi:hypothetical protein
MTNAWKDGLSLLFAAVLWQWVWIPLGIYFAAKRSTLPAEAQASPDN